MEEQDGATIDYREPDDLDAKIVEAFPGKTVRKDLTAVMKRGANVPTFVLEYLLGMYCSTDDPDMVEQGLARIRKILTENYVRQTIRAHQVEDLGAEAVHDHRQGVGALRRIPGNPCRHVRQLEH